MTATLEHAITTALTCEEAEVSREIMAEFLLLYETSPDTFGVIPMIRNYGCDDGDYCEVGPGEIENLDDLNDYQSFQLWKRG